MFSTADEFYLFTFVFVGTMVVVTMLTYLVSKTLFNRDYKMLDTKVERYMIYVGAMVERYQVSISLLLSGYHTKDVNQRLTFFHDALEVYPRLYDGYIALGYTYIEKGNLEDAIEAFGKYIDLFPNRKTGYISMAQAYTLKGDITKCLEYLEKAVEITEKSVPIILSNSSFSGLKDNERFKSIIGNNC